MRTARGDQATAGSSWCHDLGEERHLGVEAVAGLVENDRARPVDDLVGHLLAAMCGQAVEEYGVFGRVHEFLVDLVRGEDLASGRPLVLLSHGGPDVGVD